MNIWAKVDFGKVRIMQQWKLLQDEIGDDSEPHDFIQILVAGNQKQLVIQLEKDSIYLNGAEPCYLGILKASDAVILP